MAVIGFAFELRSQSIVGWRVFEIGRKSRGRHRCGCKTPIYAVGHLHTDTTMITQFCHCILLIARTAAVHNYWHMIIIVIGVAEVDTQCSIIAHAGVAGICLAAFTRCGILPISHDLCHGCGHTTGERMLPLTVGVRTMQVVGAFLRPVCLEQRLDNHSLCHRSHIIGTGKFLPFFRGGVRRVSCSG